MKRYVEIDPAVMATQFPLGFRTRVAPEFLADVFASGQRGVAWARDWLRARHLLDCSQARELVPVMGAIDALLFVDALPNFINHIGTEKLTKRALGIVTAFKAIRRESDWKKPGSAKHWVSKVDWIAARRIDPSLSDADLSFKNRELEEEIRKEMDREAGLLKARNKLEERSKGATGPTES